VTQPEAVEATAADGTVVRGEMTAGPAATWVVLVHADGGDIDDWRPLATALGREGWNLLALDLPGHGGSEGTWDAATGPDQVQLGVDFARSRGAMHVAVVAPCAGAMWALEAVARAIDDPGVALADSLVLLSPGPVGDADPDRIRGDGLAKAIISGAFAPGLEDAVTLLRASIGWTVAVRFPTDARGAAMLAGPLAVNVADKIAHFIREQAVLTGPGQHRATRS
jgi:pimeloyl-ACP methyl ester carboxylesterase